ncbi:iron-sulfur cluster assembly protein [Martiniozyma asiatica (nom. inval.)]|nr:iron-sulfur cluster assembly protein [Martiniozyma asiatica]
MENENPTVQDLSSLPTRESKKDITPEFLKTCQALQSLSDSLELTRPNVDLGSTSAGQPATTTLLEKTAGLLKECEPLDSQEVYDLIATISDPEHPLTLGQLSVVNLSDIHVRHPKIEGANFSKGLVTVLITPTITHCSLATLIGLGIRVRLERSISKLYNIEVYVKEGTHQSESQVNKQLNDKERVAAANENAQLAKVVSKMLETCV